MGGSLPCSDNARTGRQRSVPKSESTDNLQKASTSLHLIKITVKASFWREMESFQSSGAATSLQPAVVQTREQEEAFKLLKI